MRWKKVLIEVIRHSSMQMCAPHARPPLTTSCLLVVCLSLSLSLSQELKRPERDVGDDYLEMVIQFGYVCMFAAVLPVAPALALLNNWFEARVDLAKLLKSRRVPLQDRCMQWGRE